MAPTTKTDDRLFIGVFPAGFSYADRTVERHGDYKRLAFMPFESLVLKVEKDCPADLRAIIEADAATIQAKRGEDYQVSTCGQTVILGGACARHRKGDGSSWLKDARGIPLARACHKCEDAVRARYRPEIMTNPAYEAEEPIEPQ